MHRLVPPGPVTEEMEERWWAVAALVSGVATEGTRANTVTVAWEAMELRDPPESRGLLVSWVSRAAGPEATLALVEPEEMVRSAVEVEMVAPKPVMAVLAEMAVPVETAVPEEAAVPEVLVGTRPISMVALVVTAVPVVMAVVGAREDSEVPLASLAEMASMALLERTVRPEWMVPVEQGDLAVMEATAPMPAVVPVAPVVLVAREASVVPVAPAVAVEMELLVVPVVMAALAESPRSSMAAVVMAETGVTARAAPVEPQVAVAHPVSEVWAEHPVSTVTRGTPPSVWAHHE